MGSDGAVRGVAVVIMFVVDVCSFRVIRLVSLFFVPFRRVSCFVCVIACAVDVRAWDEAVLGSCCVRSSFPSGERAA